VKKIQTIAIFDIGKTNKKFFLFDKNYNVLFEKSARLNETTDEDGDPCEDLDQLHNFIFDSLDEAFEMPQFEIDALNFSAYGASLVYVDEEGKPLTPLYNYLKTYPSELSNELYSKYGGEEEFSVVTASPALGSLNSGLQLYRLKKQHPAIFKKVKYAVHLPQYLSSLITKKLYSDITSIGCHTALWDFTIEGYHQWVKDEGLLAKLAPIIPSNTVMKANYKGHQLDCGVGLHDSSAALMPYMTVKEQFVLLSTGTWNISMNPFNHSNLTADALRKDCLCYKSPVGRSVKASRFHAGPKHESLDKNSYYEGMIRLVDEQVESTNLVLENSPVSKIIVEGGFSQNEFFMDLLSVSYPDLHVLPASVPNAAAVGAAMAVSQQSTFNSKPIFQK